MDSATHPVPGLAEKGRGGGAVPSRRPGSIRRTTSIDLHWPEGRDHPALFDARARDAVTLAGGKLREVDAHRVTGRSSLAREISAVSAGPNDVQAEALADALDGLRADGQLRARLRELFLTAEDQGSGLFQLLDDLAGATLVSTWGWFAWDGYDEALGNKIRSADISGWNGTMRGICIGLADGSSALDARGFPKMEEQHSALVPSLVRVDDPLGWHALPDLPGPVTRRARWIDVFSDGANLIAETGFQDSALLPDGQRRAIHEYRARAEFDAKGIVRNIEATPYVLPHGECPAAIHNMVRIKGQPLTALRQAVPQLLAKSDGCTHLNDVVRALAGVGHLARALEPLA